MVTGDSLGQVASQTLENLNVINRVVELPVLRPLIGMHKAEIVDEARRISTYDLSIEPHDDCCSLFVPKHPATRARADRALEAEGNLDASLLDKAIETAELIEIR